MQVVQRRERPAERFLCLEQVANVGAGVVPAAMAVAFRIERAGVIGKFGVLVAEHSPAGVNETVLSVLCGQNAVEHVDPALDEFQQIPGSAHPPTLECVGGVFLPIDKHFFIIYIKKC